MFRQRRHGRAGWRPESDLKGTGAVHRAGYARANDQDRPDLVTLEEVTPSALQNMVASAVLASLPYRCVALAISATGFLIGR